MSFNLLMYYNECYNKAHSVLEVESSTVLHPVVSNQSLSCPMTMSFF